MPKHALRVLLAEDNAVNQQLTQHLLHHLGYHVDIVADGQEVLSALACQSYDVVLMDVQMPTLDGLETTRRIRVRMPQQKQPMVVALTASSRQSDREACFRAGMDLYMEKPLEVDTLREIMQMCAYESRIHHS